MPTKILQAKIALIKKTFFNKNCYGYNLPNPII